MRRPLLVSATTVLVLAAIPVQLAAADPVSAPSETADAPAAVFTPGSPGLGDPYFPLDGNGGYDVTSYDLAIRYNPATDVLTGVATIRAGARKNLSRFDLDLAGLTVRAVTVGGRTAQWTRKGQELIITPAVGLPAGRAFTTVVRYDGVPHTIGDPQIGISGFIHTDDGAIVAGQPAVASTWFPVNDHPRDKASYTFHITVPTGLEAIANGIPTGQTASGDWTTWNWRADEPMASYLATATIGQFDITSYTAGGIRIIDAADPDLAGTRPGDIAAASFAREPEILDFLAGYFGPYPFSASGGIVDDNNKLGFALENQTRPIYSKFFFSDSGSGDSVVVHELAHQWFGDSLAVDLWQYIWLNEGFATYAQWLWSEDQGLRTVDQLFSDNYSVPADDPFWDVVIGDPQPDSLFSNSVYYRGAMTLHVLRRAIGDTDFFALLPAWAESQAGGTVSTDEFVALAEQISGQQLDGLFHDWLFTSSKPTIPGS